MKKIDNIKVLAGHFYDGIVDAGGWYSALNGLLQATEGGVFHHVAWDHHAQCVVSGVANDAQPPEKVREYELHHAASDPRIPIVMAMPVGGILLDHEHFSPQAMSRNAIYADWLAPLGYRHTLGVPVYDDGMIREWICVIREVGQSPFDDGTRDLLETLMPDLLRASRLRVHTERLAERAALGMAALDALPQALVLVDGQCAVRYLNAAAQRALAPPFGWSVRHGRVHASDPAVQERLALCVAAACRRGGGSARADTLHVNGATDGLGASAGTTVHVLPLQPMHPLAQVHHERPHALLAWACPDARFQVRQLSAMLGLTDAEARLAVVLAQGRSVKDFALAQGCSWHTARTHAKNLLRKTGLNRQTEIGHLVRSLMLG